MSIVFVGPLITQEFIDALNADLAALAASIVSPTARAVLSGSSVTMISSDYEVVIQTNGGISVILPSLAPLGQRARVSDGLGVFSTFNATVFAANSGTINGSTGGLVMNVDWETAEFRSLGNDNWGIL